MVAVQPLFVHPFQGTLIKDKTQMSVLLILLLITVTYEVHDVDSTTHNPLVGHLTHTVHSVVTAVPALHLGVRFVDTVLFGSRATSPASSYICWCHTAGVSLCCWARGRFRLCASFVTILTPHLRPGNYHIFTPRPEFLSENAITN